MNHKTTLIRITVPLWTLIAVAVYVFIMAITAEGELFILTALKVILLANAILWGIFLWIAEVRSYRRLSRPEEDFEEGLK